MPPGGNPPSDRKKPLPPPPFGGPRPPPSPTSNPPPASPASPAPPAPSRPNRASNPPPMAHGAEPAKLPPAPMPPPAGAPTAVGVPPAPAPSSASPPLFSAQPPVASPLPSAAPAPAPIAASPGSPPHGPSSASRLPLQARDSAAAIAPPGETPFEIPPLPDLSLAPDRPFVEFAKVSLKRAFRVKIDGNELTPHERTALDRAGIVQPSLRSFLVWRRSVLFGFASFLGLLVVLRAIEVFSKDYVQPGLREAAGGTLQGLNIVALLVDAAFCGLCWWQWTKWTDWKKQQRLITLGWIAFFLAPFVLYLYPLRTTLGDAENDEAGALIGSFFALQALLVLTPRALALLPGVSRAATVTKFLYPASPVPGWMLVAIAPLYAFFLFFILLIPYQVTGSGFFILSLGGFLGAAYFVTKIAWEQRGPSDRDAISRSFAKTRTGYYIAMGVGGLFLLIGLAELVDQLDMKGLTVVNLAGAALANVWILTLVGTDNAVTHLEAGRHVDGFTSPPPAAPPSPS
ncbi:MAG TPA: hypothetical protein VM261_01620 [Kofleriaceae bacterium]|nr:hypothetical protein [Kofleriaceae bacterium]